MSRLIESHFVAALRKCLFLLLRGLQRLLCRLQGHRELLESAAREVEADDQFITFHQRPRNAEQVRTAGSFIAVLPKLGIVMQGAMLHENNFTSESLKLYTRHFPNALIILSTWEEETGPATRQLEELGIRVILNKRPVYAGASNINLQIVSTRSGVLLAKEMGCERVLKTRTDQRIYAPDVGHFLYQVCQVFPVSGEWPLQRQRIVGCSLNTFKHRLYGLSDMLIYGHIDDMLLYWDVDLDNRVFSPAEQLASGTSLRSFARYRVCEIYLASEYLKKIGHHLEWTLADSWTVFKDHFCVIDKEQMDLYWPKYSRAEYRWLQYGADQRMQEFSFRDWMNLVYFDLPKNVPEGVLDLEFSR